jgi:hypothetical protein
VLWKRGEFGNFSTIELYIAEMMVEEEDSYCGLLGYGTTYSGYAIYQTTRCHNPEDSNMDLYCRQNFKSYIKNILFKL